MFGRDKTQLDLEAHPEVIAALNGMWESAYAAGRRDSLAMVEDHLAELQSHNRSHPEDTYPEQYLDGLRDAIVVIEQG